MKDLDQRIDRLPIIHLFESHWSLSSEIRDASEWQDRKIKNSDAEPPCELGAVANCLFL